jgi:tight adherence protein C
MALLAGLLATACFVAALLGYRLLRAPGEEFANLVGLVNPEASRTPRVSLLGRLLRFLDRAVGGRVLGQMSSDAHARLRRVITRAGSPDGMTVEALVQRQATWALLGLLIWLMLFLTGNPTNALVGFLFPMLGWFLPRFGLSRATRLRTQAVERELPDFLDVLAVTISAGLGFRTALRRVATLTEGAVADEMLIVLRQIDLGATRRAAFEDLRERSAAPSLHSFVVAFLQAEELGTPLTDFLATYSTELRRTAGQRARTAAARANPKIALFLTLIIMPALSLFMVGSIVLMAIGGL